MFDRQKVIDIALAEVGYLEKADKNNLDDKTANAGNQNYTKYARDMYKVTGYYNGNKQGVAWCDVFVDWCFVQAYGATDGRKLVCQPLKSSGAGVKYSAQYYKAKNQYVTEKPEAGDQIFFGTDGAYTHTGIVYKVSGNTVYTVEGNTSAGSAVIANGGAVCKKSYTLTNARIMGYGRPLYGDENASTTDNAPATETADKPAEDTGEYTLYTVKRGDTLWALSSRMLGRGNRYREIAEANGISGTLIKVGQVLKIPKS